MRFRLTYRVKERTSGTKVRARLQKRVVEVEADSKEDAIREREIMLDALVASSPRYIYRTTILAEEIPE